MKTTLLASCHLTPEHQAQLAQHYELIYVPLHKDLDAAIAEHGSRVKIVLTLGSSGLTEVQMKALPQLTLVSALGAGYENIDVAAARKLNIAVANGAGTNDDCVADQAFGLLLAAVRGIAQHDRSTREGVWRTTLGLPPHVSHRRIGILGLGTIGQKIAQRALGFEMQVGYHNRNAKPGVPHRYFDSLLGLAEWADFLIVATPGGNGTKHLINAEVLQALGKQGTLVNIARGSVVDTAALAQALKDGVIASAGLDVYESEPQPPAELIELKNVVLTPHVAGWSPVAVQASVDRFLENARRHLAGEPMVSPVL